MGFFPKGVHLYINEGNSVYSFGDVSNFEPVSASAAAFADVDGDLDQDLLISGEEVGGNRSTRLYINDGSGFFVEQVGMPFEDVYLGEIEFSDVDSDGDQDVFIAGMNNSSQAIGKLYLNDGVGNYLEDLTNIFNPFWNGDIEFIDLDGDLDEDVFIIGNNVSSVYFNDGLGNFTQDLTTTIDSMYSCDAKFHDLDGDLDFDLIISGFVQGGILKAQRYNNDGTGAFTFDTVSVLNGLYNPNISIFDFNDDSFIDVLITGRNSSAIEVAEYYQNDGFDSLYMTTGMPFAALMSGSTAFVDMDLDGDQDFIQSGTNVFALCNVYDNEGGGNWTLVGNSIFEGVKYSSVDFADIDGDGDLDVFVSGMAGQNTEFSQLYQNDGLGNYSEMLGSSIEAVAFSSCKFGDVDNDGDNDLMVTGAPNGANDFSRLYKNNGAGIFTIDFSAPFNQVATGAIEFFDMDGDNDLDLLLTGDYGTSNIFNLLINDGTGVFTLAPYNSFLQGIYDGAISIFDVDGDNDLDIFASGGATSRLYINDGLGNFSYSGANTFDNHGASGVDFADVDLDGDPDLCLTGILSGSPTTSIFLNDGSGNFNVLAGTTFNGANQATVDFSDVDSDGDPDLLITGKAYLNYTYQSDLYINDGLGNFSPSSINLPQITYGDAEFADIDGDGDEDLLITGSSPGGSVAKLYENKSCFNYVTSIDTVCFGDDFTLNGGTTIYNLVNDTVISVIIPATCDTVISQTIKVIAIDTSIIQSLTDLDVAELNADNYLWFDCDSINYNQLGVSSASFNAPYPGNFGLIMSKSTCSDTTNCVQIDTLDFYNSPGYSPLFGDVFPYPVTAPGNCDGTGYSFIWGGVQPYFYDWFTQVNNQDSLILDSLCDGIHTLKVIDVLGDSVVINYYVTDTANFLNLNNTPSTAIDTTFININDCNVNYNLPLDSAFISNLTYLSPDTIPGFDLYEVQVNYWQGGVSSFGLDTISLSPSGPTIIALSIYCPIKSQAQVLSALIVSYHPSVLGQSDLELTNLTIYPNPTNSDIYINTDVSQIKSIKIFDSRGKLVRLISVFEENLIKIDLNELNQGFYFLEFNSVTQSYSYKVIKQ